MPGVPGRHRDGVEGIGGDLLEPQTGRGAGGGRQGCAAEQGGGAEGRKATQNPPAGNGTIDDGVEIAVLRAGRVHLVPRIEGQIMISVLHDRSPCVAVAVTLFLGHL